VNAVVPTPVQQPKCPDGLTLYCDCEWTSDPEKNNIELGAVPSPVKLPKCPKGWTLHCGCDWPSDDAVSVYSKAEVSSNDAGVGFNNQFFKTIFVIAIGSLSMIAVLYLYVRSKKELMHRYEYTPINDHESVDNKL